MSKPLVAIIGAGRVGQSLGHGLRQAGYRLGALVTRRRSQAQRARRFIGAGRPTKGLSAAVLDADIFLIAPPDRAISAVAEDLARLGRKALRRKIALHTSGALSASVLRPLARQGACVGSLHPLQTFSRATRAGFRDVVFVVEGDPVAQAQAARLAKDLGGIPIRIAARKKPLYHAAATLACGRLLGLVDGAMRLFMCAGMPERHARRATLRLVCQTLANFERVGGRAAWTGPLARGDLATLGLHARALRAQTSLREAYRVLGELALRLYCPRDRRRARAFRELFAS